MIVHISGSSQSLPSSSTVLPTDNPSVGTDSAEKNGGTAPVDSKTSTPSPTDLICENGILPSALILAPTRELAVQIHTEARKLCYLSSIRPIVVYGGSDMRTQLYELAFGCDIIVATPGRLIDLIDRGVVSLSGIRFLILDEADRMLDMGFEPQIRMIVQERDCPPPDERQTLMFSATFSAEMQKLAREFLREYVWIGVGRVGSTVEKIKQNIMLASSDSNSKMELLMQALPMTSGRTIVFVQKKRTAAWVCSVLNRQCGVRADEIHGDRSQVMSFHFYEYRCSNRLFCFK